MADKKPAGDGNDALFRLILLEWEIRRAHDTVIETVLLALIDELEEAGHLSRHRLVNRLRALLGDDAMDDDELRRVMDAIRSRGIRLAKAPRSRPKKPLHSKG